MKKIKKDVPYDPSDPGQFFDMIEEAVLYEMVQYYPTQFKAMCILLTLDIQIYTEELERQAKPKRKRRKKSYDNQGEI